MLAKIMLFMFHIISYDIWYYISHRILHHRNFYFIHKKHHSKLSNKLIYLDAYSGEIIEAPLQSIGILIPCIIINKNNIVLFNAFVYVFVRGLMEHDKRFIWLVGNHHLLHHTYPNYNYGEKWIDNLLGTIK